MNYLSAAAPISLLSTTNLATFEDWVYITTQWVWFTWDTYELDLSRPSLLSLVSFNQSQTSQSTHCDKLAGRNHTEIEYVYLDFFRKKCVILACPLGFSHKRRLDMVERRVVATRYISREQGFVTRNEPIDELKSSNEQRGSSQTLSAFFPSPC